MRAKHLVKRTGIFFFIHRKFARNKEIKALIGPLFSAATPTLTPIADREKIPPVPSSGMPLKKLKTSWESREFIITALGP